MGTSWGLPKPVEASWRLCLEDDDVRDDDDVDDAGDDDDDDGPRRRRPGDGIDEDGDDCDVFTQSQCSGQSTALAGSAGRAAPPEAGSRREAAIVAALVPLEILGVYPEGAVSTAALAVMLLADEDLLTQVQSVQIGARAEIAPMVEELCEGNELARHDVPLPRPARGRARNALQNVGRAALLSVQDLIDLQNRTGNRMPAHNYATHDRIEHGNRMPAHNYGIIKFDSFQRSCQHVFCTRCLEWSALASLTLWSGWPQRTVTDDVGDC